MITYFTHNNATIITNQNSEKRIKLLSAKHERQYLKSNTISFSVVAGRQTRHVVS